MATLTFTDLRDRVMNALRIPTSDSTQATRVGDLINTVYRDIGAKYRWWWWRQAREVINTATPFVSGTMSATHGSTAITFSAAPPSEFGSFLNRSIRITAQATDSGAVFRVAVHATGTATASLDAPYTNVSTGSAAFTVNADRYDLAADCSSVRFVQRFGYRQPLEPTSPEEMEQLKAFDVTEGKPHTWSVFEFRTSGDPTTRRQVVVHPYPDAAYRLVVFYERTLNTELSGTTRSLIPDDYAEILFYGALAEGYPIFLNDTERGQYYRQKFNDLLNLMVARMREQEGNPRLAVRDDYRSFYRRGSRSQVLGRMSLGDFFGRWPNEP